MHVLANCFPRDVPACNGHKIQQHSIGLLHLLLNTVNWLSGHTKGSLFVMHML